MYEDAYFSKVVTFHAWKHTLKFRMSQDLFSSHDIDSGTRFLLRTIFEAQYERPTKILDVGCGYGPIGLTLKSLFPDSIAHLVDRDALAIDYSRQNASLNGLSNINIYGGLGYDALRETDFDLIVSNIPGKAGESVISYLLKESVYHLSHNGVVAMVVVSPLEPLVEEILNTTPAIEVLLMRTRSGYSVFHYRFINGSQIPPLGQSALERGIYDRANSEYHIGDLEFTIRSAYGLPEFDTLNFGSELVIQAINGLPKSSIQQAVILNPGQGQVPVSIWKLLQPERIILVDRDLLALRYSRINLNQNKCPDKKITLSHQPNLELANEDETDIFIIRLREENRDVNNIIIKQASENLAKNGVILVTASSTGITRLENDIQSSGILSIKSRKRRRRNSLLVLKHK
ncbi:class I SAM-dependent methyltransferase [Chloroflexota bacterium]